MGACFVPNIEVTEENLAEWQQKSQLFFLSSEQVLYKSFFYVTF